MIRKKFGKSVIAVMLSLGLMFSGSAETMMPIGTTVMVEAATKKLTLNVANKNVYVGISAKLNVKTTKGAKLSYKTSNKKIVTVDGKGNIKGRNRVFPLLVPIRQTAHIPGKAFDQKKRRWNVDSR